MRSGCRGFESRSGHLIFSTICSVYIDSISELTSLMMNKNNNDSRLHASDTVQWLHFD